jgi:hypothetical protein
LIHFITLVHEQDLCTGRQPMDGREVEEVVDNDPSIDRARAR